MVEMVRPAKFELAAVRLDSDFFLGTRPIYIVPKDTLFPL